MTNEFENTRALSRREIMELLGIAGVGTAVWASHNHIAELIETEPLFIPGTTVIDTEAATPNHAIVLLEPGVPINDWVIDPGVTVADQNPAYEATDSVVIVAFEETLSRKWPEWKTAPAADLFDEVCARSIKFYAFPRARLTPV